MKKLQKGFSIVSAIFLLVVLSFLGVAMVAFSTSQHQSSAMDVMGVRAYQASRVGIEWGAFQILQSGVAGGAFAGACQPGPTSSTLAAGTLAGTLSGYAIEVGCNSTATADANAAGGTVTVYRLTSIATQGAVGTENYVERQITVSIGQ